MALYQVKVFLFVNNPILTLRIEEGNGAQIGVFVLFGAGLVVLVLIGAIYWRKRRQVRRTSQYMMMDV